MMPRNSLVRAVLWALASLLALILLYDNYRHLISDTGENNLHAHQAAAFLRGEVAIQKRLHDCAVYEGKIYSYAPPFPAVLLMPVVAVFGVAGTNPFAVKVLLTVVNVFVLRGIFRRLGVERASAWWLVVAFLAGTAYWGLVILEGVWWFSQVVAVTCLLLAIHEALGKARGPLTGLFLAVALLSRQMSVYSGIFLAVLVWSSPARRTLLGRLAHLAGLALVSGVAVGIYLWFNAARFDNPFEPGYRYLDVGEPWKTNTERFGQFNLAYVPFNFLHMFFQGFHFQLTDHQFQMDRNGTSLTVASPWVFAAFLAVWRPRYLVAAWCSILLTVAHQLVYYSNGWAQLNAQRYMLDFLPVLLPLIALGVRRLPPVLWKAAVAYSVVLNFLMIVLLPRTWSLLTRYVNVAIGP
jgi:hypothetical protein